MGFTEQFAQRTLAEDAARIDGGLARWRRPFELHLEKVITDGSFVPLDREPGASLVAPWSELLRYRRSEILIELKMPGNHLDLREVERALLRRQALRVARLEETAPPADGTETSPPAGGTVALWIAAAHLPAWLSEAYRCERFAPGCYRIAPHHDFLWIAANELPLCDELVGFLLARSGRARDDFARWVVERRPLDWVIDMLRYIPMSAQISDELLQRFGPEADPEVEARRQRILQALLRSSPQARQELIEQGQKQGQEQGQLLATRAHLRRVLERRQLRPSSAELARIEECTELARLERWLDRAITAASVAEALAEPPA